MAAVVSRVRVTLPYPNPGHTDGPHTSLGLLAPVCLPILCRLWEQVRRWDRCLCSLPSDWAGWLGVAYAVRRQLYRETAGHGGEELEARGGRYGTVKP